MYISCSFADVGMEDAVSEVGYLRYDVLCRADL